MIQYKPWTKSGVHGAILKNPSLIFIRVKAMAVLSLAVSHATASATRIGMRETNRPRRSARIPKGVGAAKSLSLPALSALVDRITTGSILHASRVRQTMRDESETLPLVCAIRLIALETCGQCIAFVATITTKCLSINRTGAKCAAGHLERLLTLITATKLEWFAVCSAVFAIPDLDTSKESISLRELCRI